MSKFKIGDTVWLQGHSSPKMIVSDVGVVTDGNSDWCTVWYLDKNGVVQNQMITETVLSKNPSMFDTTTLSSVVCCS